MSNFQKKYNYDFKSLDNRTHTVEIWQDISTGISSTNVIGAIDPFVVTLTSLDSKFQPVRGTGADLNLLATQTLQYMDLYTANIQEYQVRHYINNELNWCGYLDTEIFYSDFSRQKNYPVAITANDGFALLERLNFVLSDGSKYQGLYTQWQVIRDILTKLNLPYKNIYVGLSTTIEGITLAASETIFHKTYCNNQNWYNEDGEAETCRKVLEEILKPYAAYIIQDNANLYITDVNTTAIATSTSFKKYDNSFNYVTTQSVNLNLGDLSTIGFKSNNTNVTAVAGFNKQVIKYSPYISDLIDYSKTDFSNVISSNVYGTVPYTWLEKTYSTSGSWLNYNNGKFADYVGNESSNVDEQDSYLKINRYSTNNVLDASTISFKLNKELPYIIPSNSKLKINMSAYFRTVNDLNGITTTSDLYQGKLRCKLKIGDRQYYRHSEVNYPSYAVSSGWRAASYNDSFDLDFESRGIKEYNKVNIVGFNSIDNNWIDLKKYTTNGGSNKTLEVRELDYLIPLTPSLLHGISGGMIEFEIYDFDIMVNPTGNTPNYTTIKSSVIDVRIKDFKLSITDSLGKEFSNSDVEYVGYINQNYKNEGEIISLYQGTSKTDNSIEKASLIGYNEGTSVYYFFKNWIRDDKTACIENLLLNSMISNYSDKFIQLNTTVTLLGSSFGCLTYSDYLPNKKFMITSYINDYANARSEISIQEVFTD